MSEMQTKADVMATIQKTVLKRYNGTTFDAVHLQTSADITQLGEAITVKGHHGLLNDGDTISSTSSVANVLRMVLTQNDPATYLEPEITFSASGGGAGVSEEGVYEVGTNLTPTLLSTYTKNDGGDVIENNVIVYGGDVVGTSTDATTTVNVDEALEEGVITYLAEIKYAAGEPKRDGGGVMEAEGVPAGTLYSEEVATYEGRRAVFFGSDANGSTGAIAGSNDIRNMCSISLAFNEDGGTDSFTANAGANRITIATPKSYGSVVAIVHSETGSNVVGQFDVAEVSVKGANDFTPATYEVRTLVFGQPIKGSMTFNVTMN